MVLAIHAAHVAVAEENCTGAFYPGNRRLLSQVLTNSVHNRQKPGMTKARFAVYAVYAALGGSNIAGRQPRFQGFGAAF